MFEKAARLKLRFNTYGSGLCTAEDLWDLPLASASLGSLSLDNIAKALNKAVKEGAEESFVAAKSAKDSVLELKFNIVKRVIEVKMAELEASKKAADNKAQKEKILRVMAAKQDASLEEQSMEGLEEMLDKLSA